MEQALARMREAAALWLDVDEHEIELNPPRSCPRLPAAPSSRYARPVRKRRADRLAIEQTKKAAAALAGRGISARRCVAPGGQPGAASNLPNLDLDPATVVADVYEGRAER